MSPDGVTSVQDGDEVVNGAHEGAAAAKASRESSPASVGAAISATSVNPARSSSTSQVTRWSGRPARSSDAGGGQASSVARGLRHDDERRTERERPAALGQQRDELARPAAGRPHRSARRPRANLGTWCSGARAPRRSRRGIRASSACRATLPRGSTPVDGRTGRRDRSHECALAAIGVHDLAAGRAAPRRGRRSARPRPRARAPGPARRRRRSDGPAPRAGPRGSQPAPRGTGTPRRPGPWPPRAPSCRRRASVRDPRRHGSDPASPLDVPRGPGPSRSDRTCPMHRGGRARSGRRGA